LHHILIFLQKYLTMLKTKSFISILGLFFLFQCSFAQSSAVMYSDATELMHQHKYNEAILMFNKIIVKSPFYYEAYADRGNCYFELGKNAEALADYNTSVSKNKDYYLVYYYRGIYYLRMKDYKAALSDFNKTIGIKPNFASVYQKRAMMYYESKEYDKSITDYTKSIEYDKSNAILYFGRGNVYAGWRSAPTIRRSRTPRTGDT
jgi:tetratricopeptide (TPR) repeat protein